MYSVVNSWSPSDKKIQQLFGQVCTYKKKLEILACIILFLLFLIQNVFNFQATQWVNLFLTLSGVEDGYGKANITSYIHMLCYHVPFFFATSGVKCYTGQGVEKTNDVIRRLYDLKSNKYDACKDGLLAVKRLDELQEFDRKPRNYRQLDTSYWNEGIMQERQERPRLSVTPREDDELNIDGMNETNLKTKLKEMNVKTRVRNVDKLRQLLKDVIYASS